MFERFTESARRVVFFARYETTVCHSIEIASEHLLLGLIRETALKELVSAEKLRAQVGMPDSPKLATSADVPLTRESKRILAHAATEAERMGSREIHCLHLALGILREPASGAARVLIEHGLTPEKLKGLLAVETFQGSSLNGPVIASVLHLQELVESSSVTLQAIRDTEKVLPEGWTRKEALGHLVDLAVATYRWLNAPKPLPMHVEKVRTWMELLQLWKLTNEKILEAAGQIPPERWTQLRLNLMESYTARTETILEEIL